MTALDAFGRRALAWPAMLIGAGLTMVAGCLLKFAAWMLDLNAEEV